MIYAENSESDFDLKTHIIDLKKKGFTDKDISIILSTIFNVNKNDVYKLALELD